MDPNIETLLYLILLGALSVVICLSRCFTVGRTDRERALLEEYRKRKRQDRLR